MTLSVDHYLTIYQLRKAMMDAGTTSASSVGRELINRLTTRLAELDPSLPCKLSKDADSSGSVLYKFVVNDEEVACFTFDPDVH